MGQKWGTWEEEALDGRISNDACGPSPFQEAELHSHPPDPLQRGLDFGDLLQKERLKVRGGARGSLGRWERILILATAPEIRGSGASLTTLPWVDSSTERVP